MRRPPARVRRAPSRIAWSGLVPLKKVAPDVWLWASGGRLSLSSSIFTQILSHSPALRRASTTERDREGVRSPSAPVSPIVRGAAPEILARAPQRPPIPLPSQSGAPAPRNPRSVSWPKPSIPRRRTRALPRATRSSFSPWRAAPPSVSPLPSRAGIFTSVRPLAGPPGPSAPRSRGCRRSRPPPSGEPLPPSRAARVITARNGGLRPREPVLAFPCLAPGSPPRPAGRRRARRARLGSPPRPAPAAPPQAGPGRPRPTPPRAPQDRP